MNTIEYQKRIDQLFSSSKSGVSISYVQIGKLKTLVFLLDKPLPQIYQCTLILGQTLHSNNKYKEKKVLIFQKTFNNIMNDISPFSNLYAKSIKNEEDNNSIITLDGEFIELNFKSESLKFKLQISEDLARANKNVNIAMEKFKKLVKTPLVKYKLIPRWCSGPAS